MQILLQRIVSLMQLIIMNYLSKFKIVRNKWHSDLSKGDIQLHENTLI